MDGREASEVVSLVEVSGFRPRNTGIPMNPVLQTCDISFASVGEVESLVGLSEELVFGFQSRSLMITSLKSWF